MPGGSEAQNSNRRLLVIALFAATFLVSLDQAVIATAMPTVVGQLGGIGVYTWVFTAYLLASTISVPLYGKLADIYGRKPVILSAIVIFLISSILCGQAQSMEQLIFFRVLQGLGAGGVLPVTQTILGDIFSLEERAKILGFFSTIWGVSGLMGPAIGGLLTEHVTWRAVFYVNAPICLVTLGLIWLFLKERVTLRQHTIDYLGAVWLSLGLLALLTGLGGGLELSGLTIPRLPLLALAALLLALFAWQERRAPEPMLPPHLFRRRVIVVCGLGALTGGVAMTVGTAFVPALAQGAFGATPTMAGLVLIPSSIGWPLGSFIVGRWMLRSGMRAPAITGGVLIAASFLMLRLSSDATGLWLPAASQFVVGLGMGFAMPVTILAVQNAVGWEERGVVTAINMFARSIGGALGLAVGGAVFAAGMVGVPAGVDPNALLSHAGQDALGSLAPATLAPLQGMLLEAVHNVTVVMLAVSVLGVLVFSQLPRDLPLGNNKPAGQRPLESQQASSGL